MISTTDALNHTTEFTYNERFKPITQRGPHPDLYREWEYNALNLPILEKNWVGHSCLETHKEYDPCNHLIATTDPGGHTTFYNYDALGRCIEIIHSDGAIEQKCYDALGNLLETINPLGHTTHYTYNFQGQVTSITYPDGVQEHSTYDSNGLLLTHRDRAGTLTSYTYDLFDNCIQTDTYSLQGELLTTTSATYSAFLKLSETDAAGVTTFYSYDFAGRLLSTTFGERVTTHTYDPLGALATTQEGDTLTAYTYDVKGQLLEKKVAMGSELLFEEHFAYDALGNQIEHSTACGTTSTHYNPLSQPTLIEDPLGHQTHIHYSYSPTFRTKTIDPHGIAKTDIYNTQGLLSESYTTNTSGERIQANQRTYDFAGNLIDNKEVVYQGTQPTREVIVHYEYDDCGRRTRTLESDSKETLFFYNSAGLLCKTVKPDQTAIIKEYDPLGRLSRLTAPGIDYSYQYDQVGNLILAGNSRSFTQRTYDIYGNITEEVLANGLVLSYTFDPYGRRTSMTYPDHSKVFYLHKGPYLYQVAYKDQIHTYTSRNLAGLPTHIELSDGSPLSITWDPLLRWKSIDSPYYSAHYEYDAIGNLSSITSQDPLGDRSEHYVYDDLSQLISENSHTYTYDSLYNRLEKDTTTYQFNSLNQLIGDYTYDTNGNLISDGILTYEYDALDRLVSSGNLLTQWTYTYDVFNRRITKSGPLKQENYMWDGNQEVGTSNQIRILGDALSEIGSSIFLDLNGKSYTPIHDVQGSIVTLIKDNKPHATQRYTAFGEPLLSSFLSPWGFAGKRLDPETNFIYFGRRYYSPSLGRWITPDPLEDIDGLNLYAYVQNSPLTLLDLHGLFSWQNAWSGIKAYGAGVVAFDIGAVKSAWDITKGIGSSFVTFSEWMGADIAYEMGDPTPFHTKSANACQNWHAFGSAVRNDPFGVGKEFGKSLVPGIVATWSNPSSIENWGRAAVDVGVLALTASQFVKATGATRATRLGSVARAAETSVADYAAVPKAPIAKCATIPKAPIHHTCTNKNYISTARGGAWSPRFEKMFEGAGLTLQSKLNKVRVPGHKGPHPLEYHRAVFKRLGDATQGLPPGTLEYKAAFEAELRLLGNDIATPGHYLNSLVTKQSIGK